MTHATQNVPDQHSSIVGGSTAARRMACPASLALEKKVPEPPSTSYAQEGTALHEMMTILLGDPDKDPYDLLPFSFTHKEGWTYEIDEAIWEKHGEPALNALLDYMDDVEKEQGAEFTYLVEKQCAFPGIPGAFGTSDVVWRCGSLGGIWDWKFGYNKVSATENAQLMFYACAALNDFPDFFKGVHDFELAIMQPACSEDPDVWETGLAELVEFREEPDVWEVGLAELVEFREELIEALDEAQRLGEEAPIAKGKHCNFARCKAVCPLHLNPAFELGDKLAAIKARQEERDMKIPMANEPEFKDDLPGLLELAETVEDFAKAIYGIAHDLAEQSDEYREQLREAGWILKDKKRGARKWVADEEKIKNGARYRGLKIDDFAPRTLLSPTQLEKQLKKLGKELPEDWAAAPPPSGTTLTRQTGDIEEHQSTRDKLAALGEKLAHLR